jgi:hypothetical protein
VVRGVLALAKLQGGSDPRAAAMVQSLQLGGTGNTVVLSFAIPAEVVDLIAKAAGHRNGEQEELGEAPAPPEAPQPPAPPDPDR